MNAWNPGNVILGEYAIEKELGHGGMGMVWLVKSQSTGRHFAVKQALIRDEKHRKAFLAELQTWIDLPEHPNIVPCRFFRTVGDEIAIFADYIEGGSLADWIVKGKLTRLEQILDVAIQFAWGLHAIHERGLIHQDVKPGNVLMTPEGVPMITDFGLARARLKAANGSFVSPALPPGQQSVLVSSGGMTPAYASPEQRNGKPLSRKTDIWSWGVSVLDMFMGGVSCPHGGHIAAEVLEALLEVERADNPAPPMPSALKDILNRCFMSDCSKRWDSCKDLAASVMHVCGQEVGRDYPRAPSRLPTAQNLAVEHDRKIQHGRWRDPRTWLREAYRATGKNPADAAHYNIPNAVSRRGAAVADLAIYDEVERLLQSAIGVDDELNGNLLASFYGDKALLSFALNDPDAVQIAADKCIAIRERLVNEKQRREYANDLASAYMHKAIFLKQYGDHRGALVMYDKCIAIQRHLVESDGRIELAGDLARAYMNKACDLTAQGEIRAALPLFEKSIGTLRAAARNSKAGPIDDDLAHVYMNKAAALLHIGDARGAAEAYEMCIKIRAPLVERHGRRDLENDLADAYMGRGVALKDLGNCVNAIEMLDQSIHIRERLVLTNRSTALSRDLAHAYVNKANALLAIQKVGAAGQLYGKACSIYERLVVDEGQSQVANDLANVYMCMANAKRTAGDLRLALQLHEKCIAIRERLLAKDGRTEFEGDLAKAYTSKANALNDLGEHAKALLAHDKCIAILERMVYDEEREELAELLAVAYANKAAPAKKLGDWQQAMSLYKSAIDIYQQLTSRGRSDLRSRLAWTQLSRASVLLASGNMTPGEVIRAREAYALARIVAEESGDSDSLHLVEWSKQALGDVLFDNQAQTKSVFCLPSGLRGYVSHEAVIVDFSKVTKWLRCPPGHFWFATPNVAMSPPPYAPNDEIALEEVSAPTPKNRAEAMEFVHVYIEGVDHGVYWRGDWMGSFHETYQLSTEDKRAWLQWVSMTGEFLDGVMKCATKEAARAAAISDVLEAAPVVRYSVVPSNEINAWRAVHQNADRIYKLSELMSRSYKVTSGMHQMDYEAAVNAVAAGLHDQGYEIVHAERDRNAPCSLIVQNPRESVGIKVTVVRTPDVPGYSDEDVIALRKSCARKADRCAVAPVGLMPGTRRSPEGHQEYYIKFEGLVSV